MIPPEAHSKRLGCTGGLTSGAIPTPRPGSTAALFGSVPLWRQTNCWIEMAEELIQSPVQLWLLPKVKPLDSFGSNFFRNLPAAPGVYLMSGEKERLLYVGKAKNLKKRINSYRQIQPDRSSRKLVRLVSEVTSITYEVCSSPEVALLRENELLRLHKPKYNVKNTRPEFYHFIGCRVTPNEIHLRLTHQAVHFAEETLHGAFKSLGRVRIGFASLLRLLWTMENRPTSVHNFPIQLFDKDFPTGFSLKMQRLDAVHVGEVLRRMLDGHDDAILSQIKNAITETQNDELCLRQLINLDLEKLDQFYQFGPARNKRLKQLCFYDNEIIAQNDLDDLLVLASKPTQHTLFQVSPNMKVNSEP